MTINDLMNDAIRMLDVTVRGGYDGNTQTAQDKQAVLAQHVVDGLRRLYALRPEARYLNGVLDDPVFPTALADLKAYEVKINPKWKLGVVYFAVARCHEEGITDSVNLQLAQTLKKEADAVFMS